MKNLLIVALTALSFSVMADTSTVTEEQVNVPAVEQTQSVDTTAVSSDAPEEAESRSLVEWLKDIRARINEHLDSISDDSDQPVVPDTETEVVEEPVTDSAGDEAPVLVDIPDEAKVSDPVKG